MDRKAVSGLILTMLLIGVFLVLPVELGRAQTYTVHFICSTMNRGNGGSITFAGTTYQHGQSASYGWGDYWVTGNPPSPTSDWFFYRWRVMWLGSQSWVDNQYAQSTWFHLRGEVYLEADFYSSIQANSPMYPTVVYGEKQRVTGSAKQYYSQQLSVCYYLRGSGYGPSNPNGQPPFGCPGGAGYGWTTVTVSPSYPGTWDTGLITPTIPLFSPSYTLPMTVDVFAGWAIGSVNEVDSNVVSFVINKAPVLIAAPTLAPTAISLGESVSITDQIFSRYYINAGDMTGTWTIQVRLEGEPTWTDIISGSFTSTYGYSTVYGEYGIFYDISYLWTPSTAGIYYVRISYSGNRLYNSQTSPSSTLTVGEANHPPSTPIPTGPSFCALYKGTVPQGPWTYGSSSSDPDEDNVQITFAWDDGSSDTQSGWVASGDPVSVDHSWRELNPSGYQTGMHKIRTKATDVHGAQSDWSSSLDVTVVGREIGSNWAGYVQELTSGAVTSIEGQWIQPHFTAISFGNDGTWVGFGGIHGRLLQAGIRVTHFSYVPIAVCPFIQVVLNGVKEYDITPAWFELGSYPVTDGDLIYTNINSLGSDLWQVLVKDMTKGWTWTKLVTCKPDLTTVEWIHEPGANAGPIPFPWAPFTPIDFTLARFTINGITYKVGQTEPSLKALLFLFNFQKDDTVYTSVSPLNEYEHFTISCPITEHLPQTPITGISLHSSANLSVYDVIGNHLGYNSATGMIDWQIPNAIYLEDETGAQYAILFDPNEYDIELIGNENGEFDLHIQALVNETVVLDQWVNETITINETKTYYLIHQISLQDLVNSKTVIGQGYNCSISVVIVNNGNYTETFNVTAYANTTIIATQLVTLSSGNSATITLTWNTTDVAKGNYTISAYAWPVPGETDIADNTLPDGWVFVTIPGDINGDKYINIKDAVLLGVAFGSKQGEPTYNPNADINSDGYINIKDAVIQGTNFGKSWT